MEWKVLLESSLPPSMFAFDIETSKAFGLFCYRSLESLAFAPSCHVGILTETAIASMNLT